jgi:hypothetical protein
MSKDTKYRVLFQEIYLYIVIFLNEVIPFRSGTNYTCKAIDGNTLTF